MFSVHRGSGLGKSNRCLFTQLTSKLKGSFPSPRAGSQPGQGSRAHTHCPGEASWLSGHWGQDRGLRLGSPSSFSLEAPGLGQASQRALRESCPLLDLDEFRCPRSSGLQRTPGPAYWRPPFFLHL